MQGCKWHAIKIMAKKYYSEYELIDQAQDVKDSKRAAVEIEGKITKNSDCSLKEGQYGQNMMFSISVQNQTKALKYVADLIGATLNTFTKEDNTWDTLSVMSTKEKPKLDYMVGKNLQPGDTVLLTGVLKPNEFNGKVSLQLKNAKLRKVKFRANGEKSLTSDVDAPKTPTKNDSAPHPVMNSNDYDTLDIDEADLPF